MYGADVAYNSRASWQGYDLLRQGDPSVRDAVTVLTTTICGSAPLLCSAGAYGAAGNALLADAGLPVTPNRMTYGGREEYESLLRRLAAARRRLAFHNVHPPDELPDHLYWIPRELLTWLNDKANLAELVPAEHCPPRRVIPIDAAERLALPRGEIVVLKGSTPKSTGAGGAVLMARDRAALSRLRERLPGCERVVVEEYQVFERTMCVTWAATRTGEITYLGAAEQVVNDEGVFQGSWMGPECTVPAEAIELGRGIMVAAMARGYFGFGGFDMGLLHDGRVLAFDLNFRLCASTPSLIWLASFSRRSGARWCRLGTFSSRTCYQDMCTRARAAVDEGWFLPLGAFDPLLASWPTARPSVRGLIAGRDRAEIGDRIAALGRAGLELL